jgi:hypothetical protein
MREDMSRDYPKLLGEPVAKEIRFELDKLPRSWTKEDNDLFWEVYENILNLIDEFVELDRIARK